jgi:hypothetical protein
MTHFEEVKMWLEALDQWRSRLDAMNIPAPPKMPPSVRTWLMNQAMALDDDSHECFTPIGDPTGDCQGDGWYKCKRCTRLIGYTPFPPEDQSTPDPEPVF